MYFETNSRWFLKNYRSKQSDSVIVHSPRTEGLIDCWYWSYDLTKTGLENRDNRACANPQNYIFTLHLYSPSKQKNSGTDLFQDSPFKLLLSLVTCVVERGPRYKWFLYIQITSSEGPSPIYVHLREVSTWRREKSCHTIGRRAPKVTVDWSSNWHLSGIGTRGGPGGGIIRLV